MNFKGIRLENKNNLLQNSLIQQCGNSGLGGRGEGHLIENNVITFNNTDDYDNDWHSGGAKLIPGFSNSIIKENVFSYNKGKGLWLDDNSNNNLIIRNVSFENYDAGIEIEISRGNLVVGNISYGNNNMPAGRYRHPRDYSDYSKGFVMIEKKASIHNGIGIFVSSAPETFVYNNTCYRNASSGIVVSGRPINTSHGLMSTNRISLMNNICVGNVVTQISALSNYASDSTIGETYSDYNFVDDGLGGVLFLNETTGKKYQTLIEWSTETGNDYRSHHGTVHFVDPKKTDFRVSQEGTGLEQGKVMKIIRQYGHRLVDLQLGPLVGYEGVVVSIRYVE